MKRRTLQAGTLAIAVALCACKTKEPAERGQGSGESIRTASALWVRRPAAIWRPRC